MFVRQSLARLGDVDGAANRAYYAMFDAARVALLASGAPVELDIGRTYSGLIGAFSNFLVRKSLREQLTPKQRRGLKHDRFVLLKRERDLNDKEALLLDGWTKNYPELGAAYRLKESFYSIYEGLSSPEAAIAAYEAWNKAVVPEVWDAFHDLIRAFTNWQPFILNYFEHPVTNAYTESLNSLIRVMNRLGRGYSFEALRAKILFTEGAHKHKLSRPKFERRREPELAVAEEVMGYDYGLPPGHFGKAVPTPMKSTPKAEHPQEPPGLPKNYGADINTLIELLESGRLDPSNTLKSRYPYFFGGLLRITAFSDRNGAG